MEDEQSEKLMYRTYKMYDCHTLNTRARLATGQLYGSNGSGISHNETIEKVAIFAISEQALLCYQSYRRLMYKSHPALFSMAI